MKLTSRKLAKTSLAIALLGLLTGTAHALTPEQKELQQLRAELNALKATVQAQQAPVSVVSAPAAKSGSALSLQTKNGAEAKIYGFVRADANYKIKGANTLFSSTANSTDSTNRDPNLRGYGNSNEKLSTSIATTRLGLDFATPVAGDNKVGGKVEVDFYGGDRTGNGSLRVRHAYLTYGNWLVGQTWSTFNDLNFLPNILDFDLAPGHAATRVPMVRYETKVAPATTVAVALERANTSVSDRTPNAVVRVQQKFANDAGIVSARAFVGEAHQTGTDNEVVWGAAVGAAYKVSDNLRVMGDYNHISGDNRGYVTNAATVQEVRVPTGAVDSNGNPVTVLTGLNVKETDSVSLAASYNFTPKLSGTTGVTYVKVKDKNVAPTENEKLKYAFTNVVYKPVPAVGFGVEYTHGEAETFNGREGKDQRVGVNATYSF